MILGEEDTGFLGDKVTEDLSKTERVKESKSRTGDHRNATRIGANKTEIISDHRTNSVLNDDSFTPIIKRIETVSPEKKLKMQQDKS